MAAEKQIEKMEEGRRRTGSMGTKSQKEKSDEKGGGVVERKKVEWWKEVEGESINKKTM